MTAEEKILASTRGTRLGAILRFAYGKTTPTEFPRFLGKASVTSDGYLMADFVDSQNRHHMGAMAGDIMELQTNLAGLAVHLDLSVGDFEAMVNTVEAWIGNDYRSTRGLDVPRLEQPS